MCTLSWHWVANEILNFQVSSVSMYPSWVMLWHGENVTSSCLFLPYGSLCILSCQTSFWHYLAFLYMEQEFSPWIHQLQYLLQMHNMRWLSSHRSTEASRCFCKRIVFVPLGGGRRVDGYWEVWSFSSYLLVKLTVRILSLYTLS